MVAFPTDMADAAQAVDSVVSGAAGAKPHRHLGGTHVRDQRGHPERVEPVGAGREQLLVSDLLRHQPADAGADGTADAIAVGENVDAGVVDRLAGGVDRDLSKPIGLANGALVHVTTWIELLDLPADVDTARRHGHDPDLGNP